MPIASSIQFPKNHFHPTRMFSSPAAFVGSLLFGAIGFIAFVYGRKMALWKPMVLGVVLMAYPYVVPETWLIYDIGCALCLCLYVFRE
ncbi:MAG TPA: hypothetical protein VGN65_00720 [Casimicrobiaceae bacterium]